MRRPKFYKILILLIIFFCNTLIYAQFLNQNSDSIIFSLQPAILPLKDWHKFEMEKLELEYSKIEHEHLKFLPKPSDIIPKNPFDLDFRSSSYYVPRTVRDELNLIMNRPKEGCFVPIFTVALLAVQLAQKYVFIFPMIEINGNNVLNSYQNFPIILELWRESPQTLPQLYTKDSLNNTMTVKELQNKLELLSDNKLIKIKIIPNGEIQYFPGLTRFEMHTLLEKCMADTTFSKMDHEKFSTLNIMIKKDEL